MPLYSLYIGGINIIVTALSKGTTPNLLFVIPFLANYCWLSAGVLVPSAVLSLDQSHFVSQL